MRSGQRPSIPTTLRNRPTTIIGVGLLGAAMCFASGCGTEHGTIPVRGMVTLDGAPPPGGGKIMFTLIQPAPGVPNRPGLGMFGTDGRYTVRSFRPDDGLYAGHYGVAIECWETPPNMDGLPIKSHIPSRYNTPTTSGFELKIEPGASAVTFDLPLTSATEKKTTAARASGSRASGL